MISPDTIENLYQATKDTGLLQFHIFDKQVLLPFAQLADAVKGETGEETTEDALRSKAEAGWFPILRGGNLGEDEEGFPLYVPPRVGMLLKLEREGYTPCELKAIAEMEEWAIDNLYAADEMAYIEDNLDTVILATQDQIDAMEALVGNGGDAPALAKTRQELLLLKDLKKNGVPERLEAKIEKAAFRARAWNEGMRLDLMEQERAKIMAGYSPYLLFRSWSWGPKDGFQAGEISWEPSITSASAVTPEGELPLIRIPGFLLRGDRVIPLRTMRPAEYTEAWKELDVGGYLQAWGRVQGERRCLNCHTPLPPGNDRKQFCGDRCRNATRQRRFRDQNPKAADRAQKKYWDSLRLD